jgi:predicted RND superfamily exporter protein
MGAGSVFCIASIGIFMPLVRKFFYFITDRAWQAMLLSLILMLLFATGLPKLTKDTSADSFLSPTNPALIYKKKVQAVFGLTDPMVMAIERPEGLFEPEVLTLIQVLSQAIGQLDNVDAQSLMSISNATRLQPTLEGFESKAVFPETIRTQAQAQTIQNLLQKMPLYRGNLLAKDNSMALIVVELHDSLLGGQTYQDFVDLAAKQTLPEGVTLHVAGEGAFSGYLGEYVDNDAKRINPLTVLLITLILFIAYRSKRATLVPYVIILGTVLAALGSMGLAGIPFFVITNGMLAILLGIAVADSIHIFNQYYEVMARMPAANQQEVVVQTMVEIWHPVTLTTLTTMAGFMGLYLGSDMPPFRYLGLFCAVGVAAAWLYSIVFLPACLAKLPLKSSPAYQSELDQKIKYDVFGRWVESLGRFVLQHYLAVIVVAFVVLNLGLWGATQVQVNDSRLGVLQETTPIYLADAAINEHMGGSSILDLIVETQAPLSLLDAKVVKKVQALQDFVQSQAQVAHGLSYLDLLKQIGAMTPTGLPANWSENSQQTQAWLTLLRQHSAASTAQVINADNNLANIRFQVNYPDYIAIKPVMQTLETYIENEFNSDNLKAVLTGQVNVHYQWVSAIGASHVYSVVIALVLVWLMATFVFRSWVAGLLTMTPVISSVLLIYALMGFMNISLGIGTSMFASVAIGLGVDFAIHTVARVQQLFAARSQDASFDATILAMFPNTGRALLFNFLTIGLGFAVLLISDVTPLNQFGGIVFLAVGTSYLASMTLLPALIKIIRPKFIAGVAPLHADKPTENS